MMPVPVQLSRELLYPGMVPADYVLVPDRRAESSTTTTQRGQDEPGLRSGERSNCRFLREACGIDLTAKPASSQRDQQADQHEHNRQISTGSFPLSGAQPAICRRVAVESAEALVLGRSPVSPNGPEAATAGWERSGRCRYHSPGTTHCSGWQRGIEMNLVVRGGTQEAFAGRTGFNCHWR